jgi:hypothetical protein
MASLVEEAVAPFGRETSWCRRLQRPLVDLVRWRAQVTHTRRRLAVEGESERGSHRSLLPHLAPASFALPRCAVCQSGVRQIHAREHRLRPLEMVQQRQRARFARLDHGSRALHLAAFAFVSLMTQPPPLPRLSRMACVPASICSVAA